MAELPPPWLVCPPLVDSISADVGATGLEFLHSVDSASGSHSDETSDHSAGSTHSTGSDIPMTVTLTLAQLREFAQLVRRNEGLAVDSTDAVLAALRAMMAADAVFQTHTSLHVESVGPLPRTHVPNALEFRAEALEPYCGTGGEKDADALLAAYIAETPAGFIEPLCAPDRLEVGDTPPERKPIMDMYKKQEASFWTMGEIDMARDLTDWETKLTANERFYISRVLAFFAQADGLVADNCGSNFGDEITWREFRLCYAFQAAIEGIHNITYTELIRTVVREPAERATLFKAITTIPTIGAKGTWMRKYMSRDLPLAARLVAFVVAEGVFFSAAFCAIFWLRKRNLLAGLTFSNELISRDEGMHAETGCLAYSYIVRQLPPAYLHAIFRDAVAVEHEFVRDALPVALIGMNADLMCQYVDFVADYWLRRLGVPPLYGADNPFSWMDMISVDGKANFFERRVGEYAKANLHTSGGGGGAGAGSRPEDNMFRTDLEDW